MNSDWCYAKDPASASDVDAAQDLMQCKLGWYANPIYGNGDYPDRMKKRIAKKAEDLGMAQSPLPEFTEEEKKLNKGAYDFVKLGRTRLTRHADS